MKDNGAKSFVTIMIVIAVSSLIVREGVEGLININISQNESNAQGTLKLIAASLENYANDNHDSYPTSFSVLSQVRPAYLDKDYISLSPIRGYNYGCSKLESSGYSCYARPARCGLTGRSTYTIATRSALTIEECKRNE